MNVRFLFFMSLKLVTDGILRGCGLMGRFMVATFTDLILRVGMAIVLSGTELGSTGIWLSWPIGWCIGTVLSIVFYATAIRKALGQPSLKKEAEDLVEELHEGIKLTKYGSAWLPNAASISPIRSFRGIEGSDKRRGYSGFSRNRARISFISERISSSRCSSWASSYRLPPYTLAVSVMMLHLHSI